MISDAMPLIWCYGLLTKLITCCHRHVDTKTFWKINLWYRFILIWQGIFFYLADIVIIQAVSISPIQLTRDKGGMCLGPVSLTTFTRNSNSMETSPCCNSVAGNYNTSCTCHDSTSVVSYTKFCSDHCIKIEVRVKGNWNRAWNGAQV